MELYGCRDEEDLKGDEGGETRIKIYCMNKITLDKNKV